MGLYFILVYMHIMLAVCWVGYVLFWFLVIPSLKTEFGERGSGLIDQIDDARWPPISRPTFLRSKLPGLGWSFMAGLAATGLVLLYLRGFTLTEITSGHIFHDGLGLLGIVKIFFVATVCFTEFFRKRSIIQSRFTFVTTILIAITSVLLVR